MLDRQDKNRHVDIWNLLYEYADIRDELEDSLLSFRELHAEIEYAMEDTTDELERLQEHLAKCSERLMRFRIPQQINNQKGFSINEEECMNKKEAIKNMLLRNKLDGNLWCKIYKANLVKCPNVKMRNQKHCDFLNMGMILENAEKICMMPECGYVYSIIEGSATHSNAFNPRQEEYIWGAEEYHTIISRKYPDIKFASEYNLLMALLFVDIKMQKDKDINRKDSRYIMIHNKLKTNIGRYVRSPYISSKRKINRRSDSI